MKTSPPPLTAALPWFPGFYESILDSFIDQEIESTMDHEGKTWEELDEETNYAAARLAISQAWANAFAQHSGLSFEFESLESPREYNFTTDRVFVTLTPETVEKLALVRLSPEFETILKEWFTSGPGFMSFYPNEIDGIGSDGRCTWHKPLAEWDHNQLSALIAAYVLTTGEDRESLLDSIHDTSRVYEAAQHVWDAQPATVPA